MTWEYNQETGEMRHGGRVIARGYSGKGAGRNDPGMEEVAFTGPIPVGTWRIGRMYHHPRLGPVTMDLTPAGHDAHGRTDFRIHGEKVGVPAGSASDGCIVLSPKSVREAIARSGDNLLEVVNKTHT